MNLIRYTNRNPLARRSSLFAPFASIEDEIDRLVQSAFASTFPEFEAVSSRGYPRVDLYEDKENFYFRVDLPGMEKKDIQVELSEGVLTISGERKSFASDGEAQTSTKFSRSVSVPSLVKEDKVSATYENGVLTVTLPKAEEVKPKHIAIDVK
ncbi:MAG: Hsp20/alpha crystallin family protein [Verrucomicrobia bacterium]|nr:MAG: Hsp20/alpha crystallin family protein [Verrucomicrobiota bacterium]